jgi:hypothetical protein
VGGQSEEGLADGSHIGCKGCTVVVAAVAAVEDDAEDVGNSYTLADAGRVAGVEAAEHVCFAVSESRRSPTLL